MRQRYAFRVMANLWSIEERSGTIVTWRANTLPQFVRCVTCNWNFENWTIISLSRVFFHNNSTYDSHMIIKHLHIKNAKITVIPNNTEKFIGFQIDGIRYLDSIKFLTSSLGAKDIKSTIVSRTYTSTGAEASLAVFFCPTVFIANGKFLRTRRSAKRDRYCTCWNAPRDVCGSVKPCICIQALWDGWMCRTSQAYHSESE